jgi:hypothetical protein
MTLTASRAPNRFWDHLSFCVTLFWVLRKAKHLRVGQLIDNALFDETAAPIGPEITPDAKARAVTAAAKRANFLFSVDDERLAFLLEEWSRRFLGK